MCAAALSDQDIKLPFVLGRQARGMRGVCSDAAHTKNIKNTNHCIKKSTLCDIAFGRTRALHFRWRAQSVTHTLMHYTHTAGVQTLNCMLHANLTFRRFIYVLASCRGCTESLNIKSAKLFLAPIKAKPISSSQQNS